MAESAQSWWRCQCPISHCKKKLPGCATHEEIFGKLVWHLQQSQKHPMSEEDALKLIEENPNAFWEDNDEGNFEKAQDQKDGDDRDRNHRDGDRDRRGRDEHRDDQ